MREILDAERSAIMERIRERCSTSVSDRAECAGRLEDFVRVYPYPYPSPLPHADFAWATADRISREGGKFNIS